MAETLSASARVGGSTRGTDRILLVRVVTVAVVLVAWEAVARSGLLYRDVVPSLTAVAAGLWEIFIDPFFYSSFRVTATEIVFGLAIGGGLGILVGLGIGINRFAGRAYEPLIYYLGPTPKIIFFPLLIMWFGIGSSSKVAMGAISAFFPVVLSVASGTRHIDPVLVRVGKSFRASTPQMATKVYLPAMREPLVNGFRLAFGVCVIGVLLAEMKFAYAGLGFMVTQFYQQFDMPALYGLVIVIFVVAIGINSLLGRLSHAKRL